MAIFAKLYRKDINLMPFYVRFSCLHVTTQPKDYTQQIQYISKRFEFEHRRNKDSAINNLHRNELN